MKALCLYPKQHDKKKEALGHANPAKTHAFHQPSTPTPDFDDDDNDDTTTFSDTAAPPAPSIALLQPLSYAAVAASTSHHALPLRPSSSLQIKNRTRHEQTRHHTHTSLRGIRTPKHTAGHSLGSPTYCAHLPNRLDAYRIRLSPPRLALPRISQAPHHSPHRTAPHARNGWDS
ncbi:hypothetical protein CGCF415_v010113 [Colletotrichum fructicola]|nr:hypothetical protein CGCFRS4_v003730 [Colletotrichum fructicola]KAF4900350.1 hypothetical protein CGCF415_v010113 [Colletotrichum fructicola]KAF4925279.1 hypothetical protein CGCF245_v014138 [Colletotrichum fructicola]